MKETKTKHIVLYPEVYDEFVKLGHTGETPNDLLKRLLKEMGENKKGK